MRKAVFLDKDGTLVEDVPYNVDPAKIRFTQRAFEALRQLQENDFLLIVVTNQSGVALGYFKEEELQIVEVSLRATLQTQHVQLNGFYYCPHAPTRTSEAGCSCRKPAPGLLVQAAQELSIHLAASWMIGDILNDVEAGHRAGCKAILIENGNETEWELNKFRTPDYTVKDLKEAADIICTQEKVL